MTIFGLLPWASILSSPVSFLYGAWTLNLSIPLLLVTQYVVLLNIGMSLLLPLTVCGVTKYRGWGTSHCLIKPQCLLLLKSAGQCIAFYKSHLLWTCGGMFFFGEAYFCMSIIMWICGWHVVPLLYMYSLLATLELPLAYLSAVILASLPAVKKTFFFGRKSCCCIAELGCPGTFGNR